MSKLIRFAWVTLGINVVVILAGAVVRATGSGAGCGTSWPRCQGQVVPELSGATAIEFTHRALSGVALVAVAILVYRVFRATSRSAPARTGAVVTGVSIVIEALIGLVIVTFEWVADDASLARAISVPIHLVSTFVLLAGLTLTIFWLGGGGRLQRHHRVWRAALTVAAGMLLIGATGAVTALADTLFPRDGFSIGGIVSSGDGENLLTTLRAVHPVVAVIVGFVAAGLALRWASAGPPAAQTAARIVAVTVGVQVFVGMANVLFGTPLWMSLVHLALADLLWVAWVWLAAEILSSGDALESTSTASVMPASE